ncbi:hypothetical protein ACMFGD_24295 (plasmid) [Escherichia coli]
MSTSTNSVQQGEQGLALIAMIIISIILFLVVWLKGTVYATCAFLHSCWGILLALPQDFALHRLAAEKYNLLAETAARADSITAAEWLDVMAETVTILYAVLLPLGLLLLYIWWGHPSRSRFSRRRVSITTLPHMLAPLSPALQYILARSNGRKRLLLDLPSPTNRLAQTPQAFVKKYRLVSGRILDERKTADCFMKQAGPELAGWKSLRPHHRALFTVFGLQFFLQDRPAAEALLDKLNISAATARKTGAYRKCRHPLPDWSLATQDFMRVARHPAARRWLKEHRFVRSGLVWLYAHDLRLNSPRWYWLKELERPLWYALHRANSSKGFIEGAGIVAIARNEGLAKSLHLPVPEPDVSMAVRGLRADLIACGLLWEEESAPPVQQETHNAGWECPEL